MSTMTDDFSEEDYTPKKKEDVDPMDMKSGQTVDLMTVDATTRKVLAAAGWKMTEDIDTDQFDVDLSCFLLDKDGQTRVDSDFVFYNNILGAELAVRHSGDDRQGGLRETDDEGITIDLDNLAYDIVKIVFVLSLYEGEQRELSFKPVYDIYFRLENTETHSPLVEFKGVQGASGTAIEIMSMERIGSAWTVTVSDQFKSGGLAEVAINYGMMISGQ